MKKIVKTRSVAMTVLNLIATLLTSVAMSFSTVIAALLVFTIFFTSIKFQKSNSNSNAVAEHKKSVG